MDNVEIASLILARAFGYGQAWHSDKDFGTARNWIPEPRATEENLNAEDTSEVTIGPRIVEKTIRADDSLPILKAVRRSSEKREKHIDGVREFKRWSRERIPWDRQVVGPRPTSITPKVDSSERAMIALAGLARPLQAILRLYATTDSTHWPLIERCAREALPKHAHGGIAEAMYRLLVHASHRASAKRLRMGETDYKAMIRPALALFEWWLSRAADDFMAQYDDAKRMQELIARLSA